MARLRKNLIRRASGVYYHRTQVGGRDRWHSLRTRDYGVALRRHDRERRKIEEMSGESRQCKEAEVIPCAGRSSRRSSEAALTLRAMRIRWGYRGVLKQWGRKRTMTAMARRIARLEDEIRALKGEHRE